MLLSAVFWSLTHYCAIPVSHHTNPLTLLTGIKGHIVAKWVPKPNLIMMALTAPPTQFVFPQCNAQPEIKHKISHTCNIIPLCPDSLDKQKVIETSIDG